MYAEEHFEGAWTALMGLLTPAEALEVATFKDLGRAMFLSGVGVGRSTPLPGDETGSLH